MRSIRSTVVESLLWAKSNKELFLDPVKSKQFFDERRIENAKPYEIPSKYETRYHIQKKVFHDMDCYVLGQEGFQKHILYLHGGGYVNQPFDQHWTFLQEICRRTHSRIVVPIYPKAPNHTVVTSFEKVLPLYEHMLETTSPSDMTIMGDSAGGGFALALAQLLKEKELPQPDDIILLSPWLDITMQNPDIDALDLESKDPMLGKEALIQWGEAYRGNIEPSNYLLSPINGSLTGLGRLSIFIGTHELFLADALKFKTLCEEQKIPLNYYEYDKMNHVFPVYPIPEAKQARQQIAEIILT